MDAILQAAAYSNLIPRARRHEKGYQRYIQSFRHVCNIATKIAKLLSNIAQMVSLSLSSNFVFSYITIQCTDYYVKIDI